MTVKLHSLTRWNILEPGKAIGFGDFPGERRIRLNLNLETLTVFHIEDAYGPRFLTTLGPGVETLEFSAAGALVIAPAEGAGEVHYQTAETEPTFATIIDPVIFTKIANRRHRNKELEEMMFRMNQNVERRLAAQAAEFEAALQRRREEDNARAAERVVSNAPGATANAGEPEVPEPEPVQPRPVESAGLDQAGDRSGSDDA